MDDREHGKVQRLRKQIDDGQTLVELEKEKALLSLEILEGLLLRVAALERRVDSLTDLDGGRG